MAVIIRHEYPDVVLPWVAERLPATLPWGWKLLKVGGDGAQFLYQPNRLSVIVSGAVREDGKRWLHVSCARPDRMPSWDEYRTAKEMFIGAEQYAVQVIPPKDRYVNIHRFCLHMFATPDDWPLPEFSGFVPAVEGRTL